MATTQEILNRLNAYVAETEDLQVDRDIWQDAILTLDEYDEERTSALGRNDGTRFALADGTVIAYRAPDVQRSSGGLAAAGHDAGWAVA